MTHKATAYKNSRNKLLLELNRQSVDIDELQADKATIQHDLEVSRKLTRYWQHQSNEALSQMERLKDMLAEGAQVSLVFIGLCYKDT